MHSPIQLTSRRFFDIELHPQDQAEGGNGFSLSQMIAVDQVDEDPTRWRAKVGVRIENEKEDHPAPYVGEITVGGYFKLTEDFPSEKAEDMVHLNAGAILYGAIRELIMSLTSQSIHGEMILPAIDARTFLPTNEQGTAAANQNE